MVFPLTTRVNAQNHLEIGGCDLVTLARDFGTPLYVFDDEHLRARAREVAARLSDGLAMPGGPFREALALYASKAYMSPYLARIFKEAGLGLDVTSEGELEIARRVDFPRERIFLHGNNKTDQEIKAALALGVRHVVVDHLGEISRLAQAAQVQGTTVQTLLRLAPAIDPHTHRFMATGVADSKFGLPIADGQALDAARRVQALAPHLQFVGIHLHIGSQIFEEAPFRAALSAGLDWAARLWETTGLEVTELDLGGGWGVGYTPEQRSMDPAEWIRAITEELAARRTRAEDLSKVRLLVEPGRALVAQAAVALYTVGAVKQIPGGRTYVSVDGGMGDNVRPALYGVQYTARIANKPTEPPVRHVAIAGRYCEQGDILIQDVNLPEITAGDCIAIPDAGAYQLPMASNYNLIPRPAVLAVRNGTARVVRRRETIEEMLWVESND